MISPTTHRTDSSLREGMLFVRTVGIAQAMARIPLMVAGLIMLALVMPAQGSYGLTRSLDLTIYPDGSTHVVANLEADPGLPDLEVQLLGPTIDNFVAVDGSEFLLDGVITGDTAVIRTLGATTVSLGYDVHDLAFKEGRVWSFVLDSPSDYTLLMPDNAVIIGMSRLPLGTEIIDDRSKVMLGGGPVRIDYVFGTHDTPVISDVEAGVSPAVLVGGVAAAAAVAVAVYVKRRTPRAADTVRSEPVDIQTIFERTPDLREDDKELVTFIRDNGGQAMEGELRKKFLLPRTTMWRAVKRLERYGLVEIAKKDQQNLVILKDATEDVQ